MQNSINQTENLIPKVDTLAGWIGGKHLLADTIGVYIRKTPHNTYLEPFFGMGNVFLKRRHKVRCEVINDYNCEIINLFRILKRHKFHRAFFLNSKVNKHN